MGYALQHVVRGAWCAATAQWQPIAVAGNGDGSGRAGLLAAARGAHPSSGSQCATALEIFGAANGTDLTACCTCSMVIQALRHATRLKRLAVAVLPYWLLLTLIPKV